MSIRIVCSWCSKKMGIKKGEAPYPISHSICPDCKKKVLAEINSIPNIQKLKNMSHERRQSYESQS